MREAGDYVVQAEVAEGGVVLTLPHPLGEQTRGRKVEDHLRFPDFAFCVNKRFNVTAPGLAAGTSS